MASGTILLAEDDENDVKLIQVLLRECRILNPLQVVFNGDEAISYLQGMGTYANRTLYPVPVLFLLDLKMPRIDGLDVLRWLQTQPEFGFPTIVLTGFGDLKTMNQAYRVGAQTFLLKPVGQQEFLSLVRGIKGIEIDGVGS